MGLSFLRARLEAEPSNNSRSDDTLGLIVIGLPTADGGSPNLKELSELPLVETKFFLALMDVFADGLRIDRCKRLDPVKDHTPSGSRNGDLTTTISQQLQRIVLLHAPRQLKS